MEKYIEIIKDDINRFIKNYLLEGELVDLKGISDLEEYIPTKYPYLSILYLIKQNGLKNDENWFVESYTPQLMDETKILQECLGHFLVDQSEFDMLLVKLKKISEEKELLSNQLISLEQENNKLKTQSKNIKDENYGHPDLPYINADKCVLIAKIGELETKLMDSINRQRDLQKQKLYFEKLCIANNLISANHIETPRSTQSHINHRYNEYLNFTKQYYRIDNVNEEMSFQDKICHKTDKDLYLSFTFEFECLCYGDCRFCISLKRDGKLVSSLKQLDVSKMSQGKSYRIVFSDIYIPAGSINSKFDLLVGMDSIKTFNLYNIEKRNISFLCENSKVFINMIRIDEGTYTIPKCMNRDSIDISIDKAFYMAEFPVNSFLWDCIMSNNYNDNIGDSSIYMTSISFNDCLVFIEKIRKLSGLNFRIPSEQEWVAANLFNEGYNIIQDMNDKIWEWCSQPFVNYSPYKVCNAEQSILRGGCDSELSDSFEKRLMLPKWINHQPIKGKAKKDLGLRLCLY